MRRSRESLRVSAPGLKEITYRNTPAFIHDPLLCVWRLEIQLITHKEEEDDNDEYSSEDDENDQDGSNIYNLSQMSARAFLRSRGTYIYLLATFKSDLLLLTIFIYQLQKVSTSVNPLLTEADALCHLFRLID